MGLEYLTVGFCSYSDNFYGLLWFVIICLVVRMIQKLTLIIIELYIKTIRLTFILLAPLSDGVWVNVTFEIPCAIDLAGGK